MKGNTPLPGLQTMTGCTHAINHAVHLHINSRSSWKEEAVVYLSLLPAMLHTEFHYCLTGMAWDTSYTVV